MFRISFDRSDRGFSLIELLIVIVLLGIMAAMAVPSFTGMIDRSQTTRALERIAADIAHTRTTAVREGRSLRISFYSESDSYDICCDQEGEILRQVRLANQYTGLNLTQSSVLRFNSRGLLNSPVRIAVERGGQSHELIVSGAGQVYRDY